MINQVKDHIKKKFGSMARFCKIAGIDDYEFRKFFAAAHKKMNPEREKRIKELQRMSNQLKNELADDLSHKLLNRIKKELVLYGGVKRFCDDHEGFTKNAIFSMLGGSRKKITPRIKELMDLLKVSR